MIVLAIIVYATWWPHPLPDDSLPPFPHIDKLIHAVMFGGLAAAAMFDYRRRKIQMTRRPLSRRVIVSICLASAVFAVFDEAMQGLMGLGRESDVLDLLADWLGIIIAAVSAPSALKAIFKN